MTTQVSLAVVAGQEKPEVWGCVKCSQLGKTCCQQREIFVTAGDRERIGAHSGLTDFWEYRAPADPSYIDPESDPTWWRSVFRTDGTRPVLNRKPDGDCLFLGSAGCVLPLETRPLVCRLYPYEYTVEGLIGISSECPPQVIPPGNTILQVLDMRTSDAIRWHRLLYDEITADPANENAAHEGRTHLRPAG